MGVLIPLFKTNDTETDLKLTAEETLRVKLIQNSIEALKREEKVVEEEISEKCKDEIDRLNVIDRKLQDLENEYEEICQKASKGHNPGIWSK